jgi:glycosyltransferase involved in cell wall biosynthesis
VRIVALVESEDHVCCRYRVAAFRPALAAAGWHLEVRPIPQTVLGRAGLGRGLETADVVILQRKLLPAWAVALLRRRVKRLIFDFDDAVWLRDSYSARGFEDPRRARRFRTIVRACDVVVAGNTFLAAEASRYTTPDRVAVIPTCVDHLKYPTATHSSREKTQLVWIGSQSTLQGLERFRQTLSAIGRAIPGIRLKLICDRPISIPGLEVILCVWNEATEAREVAEADVGISWVPDDPWSRGKCGLKILQYQAAGLPVVTNPVGVHPEMVQNGQTGILAGTEGEWIASLIQLTGSPNLRKALGANGRAQVVYKYSVNCGSDRWLELLANLAGLVRFRKSG